jgi:16S rRNA (cytosine967-C5)-methyltransferase
LAPDKSRQIHSQVRAAALVWKEIRESSYPADRWLGNYFHQHRKKFGSRDRRFISETIYALFRHKTFLQLWADVLGEKAPEFMVLSAAASEGLIAEKEFQNQLGVYPGEKFNSYYDSLLQRRLPEEIQGKDAAERMSLRHSFPLWLIQKWAAFFEPEKLKALVESCQERPPFVIRTNTLKISREGLMEKLTRRGLKLAPTLRSRFGILFEERANLFDSEEFREGFFEVQDEGSQIVCQIIDPKPGEIIWDVCAGGGGKSLAMAALMENKGRIIATDIRMKKLEDLRKRAKRAGVTSIFPADISRMQEISALKKGADKIVVDAPCSGTGTLRRNPDAKWKVKEETFQNNQRDQLEIVRSALKHLRPGGRLYYITCSLEPEENEEVMKEILKENQGLESVRSSEMPDGFLRLTPYEHQTDGFFLAVVEKRN